MKGTSAIVLSALIFGTGAIHSLLLHFSIPAATGAEVYVATQEDAGFAQQVIAKEREGLDALKGGDVKKFADLTANEAVLVDARGPATKEQVISNVAGFKLTDYVMENAKFIRLAPNSGLIVYTNTERGVSHGHEFVAKVYVSSIWERRNRDWFCLFSQETAAAHNE